MNIIHFYIQRDTEANADLVIGTPEYNKIRYPANYNGRGKPMWMYTLEYDLKTKRERKWKYSRSPNGVVTHRAGHILNNDISMCISNNLNFKSKSVEYRAKTGEVFLYDQYVGSVDKKLNRFNTFTLKNINTKEVRHRLSAFGVDLISKKGKTYWKMEFGKNYFESILKEYGSEEILKYEFRNIFPKMKILKIETTEIVKYKVICQIVSELTYPIRSFRKTDITRDADTRTTDIFKWQKTDLQWEQMSLEWEDEVVTVAPLKTAIPVGWLNPNPSTRLEIW